MGHSAVAVSPMHLNNDNGAMTWGTPPWGALRSLGDDDHGGCDVGIFQSVVNPLSLDTIVLGLQHGAYFHCQPSPTSTAIAALRWRHQPCITSTMTTGACDDIPLSSPAFQLKGGGAGDCNKGNLVLSPTPCSLGEDDGGISRYPFFLPIHPQPSLTWVNNSDLFTRYTHPVLDAISSFPFVVAIFLWASRQNRPRTLRTGFRLDERGHKNCRPVCHSGM